MCRNLLKRVPRWEEYKHFFNITVLRYLVLWFALVPFASSLLRGLDGPITINLGETKVTLALGLPFSWQLLWLSSFFFFLSITVYYLRCPSFVRKYNNYGEYLAYGHDPRWLAWEAQTLVNEGQGLHTLVERLMEKKYLVNVKNKHEGEKNPVVGEKQTKLHFDYEGAHYVLAMPQLGDSAAEAERGIFWEIFGRYSGSRVWSRVLILILLIAASILFMAVLLQHVWVGAQEVYRWFGGWIENVDLINWCCLCCQRVTKT